MSNEALTVRLRAMFVEELDEQVREANVSLLALERAPGDGEQLRSLFRVMHTLKGAARAADVLPVERLCHRLEALLAAARDAGRPLSRAELDTLFTGVDGLTAAEVTMRSGQAVTDEDIERGRSAAAEEPVPQPASLPETSAPV
ncbi:MAG: Hpt domain-containing protein, partial [Gemmatimonadaceae bacterium]